MPTSNRVQRDPFSDDGEYLGGFAVDRFKKGWRIYECWSDYTTTSGGFLVKGTAVRRYDPHAGADEGRIATFSTKEEAVAYYEKWIKPHTKVIAARSPEPPKGE